MHKKKASLVPLNYDYPLSSEHDEAPLEGELILSPNGSSPQVLSPRKVPGRPKSPENPSPCSCNSTAVPSRANSSQLKSPPPSSTITPNTTADIQFAVDGHRATVTITSQDLKISYNPSRNCCLCIPPGQRNETIPFNEILSAQPLPPVTTKFLWHPFPETTHRLAVYTFRRSNRNPTHWIPRSIILSTPAEGIVQRWAAAINSAAASHCHRPHHLLVLINPYGGKRKGVDVYNQHVAAVFEKAGIKTAVRRTQFSGHARNLILEMSAEELSSYDGIVAVGGDGLFHEIVNGLLTLRVTAVKRTTTEAGGDPFLAMQAHHSQNGVSEVELRKKAALAHAMRVGHIPAGSTDAVACTLNGTRNAFSAAMRIALGDGVPLDVLRIDTADGTTEFATCMASYGFMGDLMAESEALRWIGPLRYELVGAKMLAANRSYRVKISYLPAELPSSGSFKHVCHAKCALCRRSEQSVYYHHTSPSSSLATKSAQVAAVGGPSGDSSTSSATNSPANVNTPMIPSPFSSSHHNNAEIASEEPSAAATAVTPKEKDQHPITMLRTASTFARHSRHSLNHRPRDWITVEDDFAGIMLVIMPCRSDKSAAGVARYGHLSDGNIHLVLVRRCSRLQYLRFLLNMSSTGLEPGLHHGGYVEVIPAVAVRVEAGVGNESQWNVDGELIKCASITAETHRGAIEVFARGVELGDNHHQFK